MKILYYLPSLYTSGGLERIITMKANYLAEKGNCEVIMLTSEQNNRAPYYPLSEKIIHQDIHVPIDSVPGRFRLTKLMRYPYKYYLFKRRFENALFQLKPDICISTLRRELNFIHNIQDGSIKIGEFHVTRNAYHAASVYGNNTLKKAFKKYWGNLFVSNLKKLDKLVLLTREERNNWPELGNLTVINNALPFFPEQTSSCSSKTVIAVGRYSYQKGFDLLIEAWKGVHSRHPDWQLHIYGEGEKETLDRQIQTHGLANSCFLEKAVNNIEEKYLESSVFVLSSRYEGFGMVLAEAMACGVPPVSFACPCGPKDIIQNGEDGLLVEPENTKELAEKICFLIEHEKIRKEMGRKAKISAERFKIDHIMEQWKELFESLTANRIN